MAEKFAQSWLQDNNLMSSYRVISRGITDRYDPSSPASQFGVQVLAKDFGLDLSQHRSALITEKELNNAVAIVCVTRSHVEYLRSQFPSVNTKKLFTLRNNVSDPWHATLEVYRSCAYEMKPLVEEVMEEMVNTGGNKGVSKDSEDRKCRSRDSK